MSHEHSEEIRAFLAETPPFQELDGPTLDALAEAARVQAYAPGSVILAQGGRPADALEVVARGSAKVFVAPPGGGEVLVDHRSEGDAIGFLSLYGGDAPRSTVVAAEDTICYRIPREPFLALFNAHAAVREHFHRTFVAKYLDKAFADLGGRGLCGGGGERLLFTTTVGDVAPRAVVTAPRQTSIRAAAELMSRSRVSSVVITEADGAPAGIVTDRDLRDKVAAPGRDVGEPVANIMSGAILRVEAASFCFEALLLMIRHNVHHLLVVDQGRLCGMITNHDLMMLQGNSPLAVAREIESQERLEGLVAPAAKINRLVGLLLDEGAKGGHIAHIITEINDRLVRKALELLERRLGPAPLPWCWIVFGSEGRREQTFKTDQDNALVYADPAGEDEERRAQEWFAAFAGEAREALIRCGFPVCPADYMASNPQWRRPLAAWKRLFSEWITRPTAEAVLRSMIFFDFRPLFGAAELALGLREHLTSAIGREPAFLGFVANRLVKNPPPIGFFQRFVVEKGGEHKDMLNLKVKGLSPIVDLVRFFSFEKGVAETATLERIRALRERHTIVAGCAEELEHAFESVLRLRIAHQHAQVAAGAAPDNFINPNDLSSLERKTLKDAFTLVARLQDLVIERYRASIW